MRLKLTIAYDGADFKGWQRQRAGVLTCQSVLEQALSEIERRPVTVNGSGRTDAGVHALGQVAHCDVERGYTMGKWREAINALLRPRPMAVLEVETVANDFHARFSALQRQYHYRILNRRAPPVHRRGQVWHVPQALNIDAMHRAAQSFLGKHDLTSFRAAGCQAASPVKTIDSIVVEQRANEIVITIAAPSFLYHQVRNMVGSLVEIGRGKESKDWIAALLKARDRAQAGITAPPQGLYFERVIY